ncbi:MAG: hypothetical protein A2270_02510 [Elusimicrobia bacterium RIFOXYA12_FULL_51_18]|nr:MAG: hypothetical protein A2270_02510 [Elusimicrobia bacterium RIFOXYA12_FULL_51_18]OGS31286.1 MAG: hypothetical protein A2218_08095 [Elusimicrobia bacterium RIFOXYA2_FULL_53_38]
MNSSPKTLEEALMWSAGPTDKEKAIFSAMLKIEATLLSATTKDVYVKMRTFVIALHAIIERLLNHLLKELSLSCGEEANFSCKICKLENYFKPSTLKHLRKINQFRNGFAHLYPQRHKKFNNLPEIPGLSSPGMNGSPERRGGHFRIAAMREV